MLDGYRVVAVHAHPDDESLWTGGALAQLARLGADVTVITCTLGEEGEVIGAPYQGLIADGGADQLGGFRIGELHHALAELGVSGRFLDHVGAFRDSGMAGSPAHDNPRAFVNNTEQAVEALVKEFTALRPHLVLTYGPDGGYGHPDHIQAHRITHLAAEQVEIPRIVWAVTLRDEIDAGCDSITVVPDGWREAAEGELAAVEKSDVVVELSDADYRAKREAMRAHATQLWIADGTTSETNPQAAHAETNNGMDVFALSNLIAQPLLYREHYQLGAGQEFTGHTPHPLLAGLQ